MAKAKTKPQLCCEQLRINGLLTHETGCTEQYVDEIRELAELVDQEQASALEYAESEEGCEAEYCQSFGYGDSDLDLDDLDDEAAALVNLVMLKLRPRSFRKVIQRCCNLELTDEYQRVTNSVFRQQIGELEVQLSEDIEKRILALPKDVRERNGLGRYVYTNSGSAWHMVLDEAKLKRAVDGILKSRPSWNRHRRLPKLEIKPANTPMHRRAQFRLIQGGAA